MTHLTLTQASALHQLARLADERQHRRSPETMELTDAEKLIITRGNCPDCGYRGFVLGPRGGASINIECGNLACRARFNVTAARNHWIVFAQRIPRESEGGSNWK